ncbi:glycine cleavage system H protein [Stackebrandtia endophytica]|uniref:Glycine cleavage system H protein n=1 Tax=Stackebrandtia endophytica TaxID=1496996 RepID=A0A543B4E7_9ACTN|nr:glycine cleavage system protein GcvH [Stackebrandtia endophytica]TQL79706.1 glycine cleavage system H protein [Stackebrandtia endophytica]
MIPENLRYTAEHEWISQPKDAVVRIGITEYAQSALGDIVFVQLPEAGTKVTAGEVIGEVESTKSVSDIFAPLSGTVAARNEALTDAPETINSSPYEDGWMLDIECDDVADVSGLLDAKAYAKLTE